jgi:hypothetical protein
MAHAILRCRPFLMFSICPMKLIFDAALIAIKLENMKSVNY